MTDHKNPPPQTNSTPVVTREQAIKFLEGACRNWSKVPRLSDDDLQDVATELSRFAASRPAPQDHLRVATPELAGIELAGVAEQLKEGTGAWRACSGCHELIEGHPTGPWSETLQSYMGGGCRECGGIGAVWDNTDYSQREGEAP